MSRRLLQCYGGQSCVNSAMNVSGTSLHSEQIMYRVIKSCAKVMAHKPKQIPLLQTLTSRPWNFDSRKSSGHISAEAILERSVTGDQFYLGFSWQHCHLPQPAGREGKGSGRGGRHRAQLGSWHPGTRPALPRTWEWLRKCYLEKRLPTTALRAVIPVGRDFSRRNRRLSIMLTTPPGTLLPCEAQPLPSCTPVWLGLRCHCKTTLQTILLNDPHLKYFIFKAKDVIDSVYSTVPRTTGLVPPRDNEHRTPKGNTIKGKHSAPHSKIKIVLSASPTRPLASLPK